MPISSSTFRRVTQSPFPRRNLRVPGEGPQPCRCMLVGEKPGRDESHRGKPFVGLSGKYLDLCLSAANIDRSTLFITNCVFTFTEYSKPAQWELDRDKPALIAEILACDPEIIGLLGGWSVEWVLGRVKSEIEKIHGVSIAVDSLFGGELTFSSLTSSHPGTAWTVLPMLHPANCLHQPEIMGAVLDDVLTLGKLLDGEVGLVRDEVDEGDLDYRIATAKDLEEILP